jgi:hypothetical protein
VVSAVGQRVHNLRGVLLAELMREHLSGA